MADLFGIHNFLAETTDAMVAFSDLTDLVKGCFALNFLSELNMDK